MFELPVRWVRLCVSLLVIAGVFQGSVDAQESWAVVIGINDYELFASVDEGDLRGAVHDALAMKDVLQRRWGVPDSNIRMLLDRDGTRAGIHSAVTEWLPARVSPGDRVFFFFAGHGGQILDEDGDEVDGLDETISPADILADSYARDIRDDELREWLGELPAGQIIVILDSCHSGTATRLFGAYLQSRSLPRAPISGAPAAASRRATGGPSAVDRDDRIIEIAAAEAGQPAMDMSFLDERGAHDFYGGAFTTHFVRQINAASDSATFGDIYRSTVTAMKAARLTQDPQFRGPTDQAIFGLAVQSVEVLSQAGSVELPTVVDVQGARVVIEFPADVELEPDDVLTDSAGSLVRIEEIPTDGRAVATLFLGAVDPGTTLEMAGVTLPDGILRVQLGALEAPQGSELRTLLEGLDGVEEADDGATSADLFASLTADGRVLRLLGRDGAVRVALALNGEGLPVESIRRHLLREATLQQVAALTHPDPPFSVTLRTLDAASVFQIGDPVGFTVLSERDGYLTLLDLSPDGTLTVLYPNPWGGDGRVRAGVLHTVPGSDMPFEIRATPPAGSGFVRAIVTETPLELPLDPSGFLSDPGGIELARSLRRGLSQAGGSTRGLQVFRREDQVLAGSWSTTILAYQVR